MKSKPWREIAVFYDELVGKYGLDFRGMRDLSVAIARSPYAGGLHGCTSMHELFVAQIPEFDSEAEALRISEHHRLLHFRFSEAPSRPAAWSRTVPPEEGFSTFEHFILARKKWWREQPPPR